VGGERRAAARRALVREPRCVSFVGELGSAVVAARVASNLVIHIRGSGSRMCGARRSDHLDSAASPHHTLIVRPTRMARKKTKEKVLRTLEDELRNRLRADLPRVAAGEESLYFFNSQFNPHALPSTRFSARGCEAFEVASQILALRKELDIVGESGAQPFLQAVAKHASADPQRLGARRLAVQLLADLEAFWQSENMS